MRPECEKAVAAALGRPLKAGEATDIEAAVSRQVRLAAREDPKAWSAMTNEERLKVGAERAAQQLLHEALKKQQRLRLQIAAHDRLENALQAGFAAIPKKRQGDAAERLRVVSNMLAFDPRGHGQMSAYSWSQGIQHEAFGRLMPLWQSVKGFAGLFENQKGVSDLVHEMFGESTGNAAAREGAKVWRTVTEELRARANAAGMDIGKLEGWHYPQNHSQSRIAQAGIDKWVGDTLPLLDRDQYLHEDGSRMTDVEMRGFLEHAWDTIITDGQNKQTPGQIAGAGGIANRMSAHRAIFYKDADSYLTYAGQYGDKNLWNTLSGHIRAISRDVGLTETMGPNPDATFKYFNDRTQLESKRAFPTKADRINSAAKFNDALYDLVAGKTAVVNQRVQDLAQTFRNWEVSTKLGQVVVTALGDEAGVSATAYANGVPWTEVLQREIAYMNPANAADRNAAAEAGLGINTMMGGLNRFGSEDLNMFQGTGKAAAAREFSAKMANTVLHASGAEAMWDTRRKALGSVLMSHLGRRVHEVEHVADLHQADHGILANKGVSEADWQVWRRAELEDWGMKHGVLTPKSVWAMPDARIDEAIAPTIAGIREDAATAAQKLSERMNAAAPRDGESTADKATRIQSAVDSINARVDPRIAQARVAARRHASTSLLGHVLEEVGMGVMDTGPRERAKMSLSTRPGSWGGELVRSAMLFKGFSVSMMQKHWARASDMPTGAGTALYAARLITVGTIMGAVAQQIRALVAGQDPPNIAEPKFWGTAILRGGGLGFYGDFLYAEMTQHDTSLIPALMGPLATEAETAWNLTGAAMFKAGRGERTDEGGNVVRWARGNVPLLNMWYTKAAFDHLLWNDAQEAVSPGYLDRMMNRANTQKGTNWWWDPHDSLPQASPDMGQLWRPELGARQLESFGDTVDRIRGTFSAFGDSPDDARIK